MAMRTLLCLAALCLSVLGPGCTRGDATDAGGIDAGSVDSGARDTPASDTSDAGARDVPPGLDTPSDTPRTDARTDTPMSCPDEDLGMRVGSPVVMGSTATATARRTADCAGGEPSPARFYSWTAPGDATYIIQTMGSSYDTALVLLDGSSCAGTELDCDDDGGGDLTSRLAVDATAGDTFVIVVTGYDGMESGSFRLSIQEGVGDEVGLCANGMDDDADGDTDCFDFDCDGDPACVEICNDGMDNDGNGAADCFDFDCARDPFCPEDCGNMVDDDSDGDLDCADAACSEDPRCFEANCTNGVDDDADGDADCLDFDCELDPACGSIGIDCSTILCVPGFVCLDCPDGSACLPAGMGCP